MIYGASYRELLIIAIIGAIMGIIGFYITRAIRPAVERTI